MHRETLQSWVRQAEIDGGVRPGTTSSDAQRLAKLGRENRELRRAKHLKTASALFAAEPDRPTSK
jgi:transposase